MISISIGGPPLDASCRSKAPPSLHNGLRGLDCRRATMRSFPAATSKRGGLVLSSQVQQKSPRPSGLGTGSKRLQRPPHSSPRARVQRDPLVRRGGQSSLEPSPRPPSRGLGEGRCRRCDRPHEMHSAPQETLAFVDKYRCRRLLRDGKALAQAAATRCRQRRCRLHPLIAGMFVPGACQAVQ
jgi:hypothetical protein